MGMLTSAYMPGLIPFSTKEYSTACDRLHRLWVLQEEYNVTLGKRKAIMHRIRDNLFLAGDGQAYTQATVHHHSHSSHSKRELNRYSVHEMTMRLGGEVTRLQHNTKMKEICECLASGDY